MNKLRTLTLAGLSLSGIVASTSAFATSYYECAWTLVWTYYGYELQYLCW